MVQVDREADRLRSFRQGRARCLDPAPAVEQQAHPRALGREPHGLPVEGGPHGADLAGEAVVRGRVRESSEVLLQAAVAAAGIVPQRLHETERWAAGREDARLRDRLSVLSGGAGVPRDPAAHAVGGERPWRVVDRGADRDVEAGSRADAPPGER